MTDKKKIRLIRSAIKTKPTFPPGVKLLHTLDGHQADVNSLSFDPHGRTLASGSFDKTVKQWEVSSGKLLNSFKVPQGTVESVAFDSLSEIFACATNVKTMKLWNVNSAKLLKTIKKHDEDIRCVVLDSQVGVLVGGSRGNVMLWQVPSGMQDRTIEVGWSHAHPRSIAVNPLDDSLAIGCIDGTIETWHKTEGMIFRTAEEHQEHVACIAFAPNGEILASGSADCTVKVWDAVNGRLLRTLEGHTNEVSAVAFSPDGRLLASKCTDNTFRLWSCETWEAVAVVQVPMLGESRISMIAFHPTLPLLATTGSGEAQQYRQIHLWELDFDVLLGHRWQTDSVCYKNAKVVLVGDSGVGKSGLALRMTTGKFEATESTHGRHVWLFDTREAILDSGRKQTRETLLWDLAGQPGYRLVHQLNIDEAAVALVLVDSRSETDPLGPAEFWAKAIDQARSEVPITKILVEARADRGGVSVSLGDLKRFCDSFGFAGFVRTSAKTGTGVAQLKQAVSNAIPWDKLPEVISTKLFTRIRDFLQVEKQRGDKVLVEELDRFRERYTSQTGHVVSNAEFRTVVGRLEASGLAQFLVFTVFDNGKETDYVLMQPEYLDAYASAIINQARQDPRGIGHVSETRIRRGELGLTEGERISDCWAEELVIGESIEQLLKHDIALRERLPEDHDEAGDFLVLPSQYTRTSPYPGKKLPGVSYEFEGASRAIFATLVVRLTHHRHFAERDFWRDAACYATVDGGQFIVVLKELSPSRSRLSVFFDNNPPREEQIAFLRYVKSHLIAKALPNSVIEQQESRCPACSHTWDEAVVQNRLRLGKTDIICPNCEVRSPLLNLLLNDNDFKKSGQDFRMIDVDADAARKRQMAVTAIRGREQLGEYDVFLSYNSADRAVVVMVAEMLKSLGIRPWLDVWDLIPGQPWQTQLEQAIDKVKSAVVCVGASGMGPWQDHEMAAFIRKFVKRRSPVMPVVLPGLIKIPELPTFLDGFMWIDLRELKNDNPRPLANLVAGVLGRRPREMRHDALADQVTAILRPSSKSSSSEVPSDFPQIVLPVNRPELSSDELDAVILQTAQLLGISSQSVRLVRTEPGSVRIVLELKDMIAVSELFSMAHKGDPTLVKFFDRCQIRMDDFQSANETVPPALAELRREEQARQPDELDQKVGKILPPEGLKSWSGGATVATFALVFTDIVDSTKLCAGFGDAAWDGYRQLHFAQTQQFIAKSSGCFIKNTGDGVLAAFHNADDAVTFAGNIVHKTGHAVVRVRAGVHIGQVKIDGDDTFGFHVNLTARVMNYLKYDGVIISDSVKIDLENRRSPSLATLVWELHPDVSLKGIPGPQKLWELQGK